MNTTYERCRSLLLTMDRDDSLDLTEVALSQLLGTSRTPAREALHRLEQDGLLQREGRGYGVALYSPEEFVDAVVTLTALQPAVAAQAAQRQKRGLLPPASILALREALEAIDLAERSRDPSLLGRPLCLLEQRIIELSGNTVATHFLRNVWHKIELTGIHEDAHAHRLPVQGEDVAHSRTRTDVVQALSDGDPDRARELMHRHLGEVFREVSAATPARLPSL